jgi:hypothetical protein
MAACFLLESKMNEEEKTLSEIGNNFGGFTAQSLKDADQIKTYNDIFDKKAIDTAIALLVNNGYRVEKIIRNDESLALSK